MSAAISADQTGVWSSLNYLGAMADKPRFHVYERARDHLNLVAHRTFVADARAAGLSLEAHGFCLTTFRSTANLKSQKDVLRIYGREVERLVVRLSGASVAISAPLGVVRVCERSASLGNSAVHRPVRFVHSDYTDDSAMQLLWHTFGNEPGFPERRCAIYHVWRVLTPTPQDSPLALCDAGTVEADDPVAAETVLDFPGSRRGKLDATLFRFNARHRWFYFPNMTPDEVVVFRGFDSGARTFGRVPHTAFSDSTCPPDAPARVSLDLRVLAIF